MLLINYYYANLKFLYFCILNINYTLLVNNNYYQECYINEHNI